MWQQRKPASTLHAASRVGIPELLQTQLLPYAVSHCHHCPKETTPQRKRYEPAWLAGTSVGDIMFQVHETCESLLRRFTKQAGRRTTS